MHIFAISHRYASIYGNFTLNLFSSSLTFSSCYLYPCLNKCIHSYINPFLHKSKSLRKKNVPGHPGRFLSSGEKIRITSPIAKSKTLSVLLFNKSTSEKERYRIDVNNKLLSGYIEIQPHFTENDIRSRLIEVFHQKYPLICNNDFEFVRREKIIFVSRSVNKDFCWNYEAIKALIG